MYNTKMAVAILSGLNPHVAFHHVPKLPTVHGAIAHEQKGILMAQLVFGMIHTPLSRTELLNHPQGKAKIKEEADAMRALGVWGEGVGELFELEDLKRISREKGETVHVAELMPIGSIKHAESAERAKLKVRSVFRGDETRDQNGDLALFRDLKSLPATVSTINLVLYYGLRKGNCLRIADAQRAYLQAPIGSPVPTYVILPKEMWHGHWFGRYRRVAARLYKAIYGHRPVVMTGPATSMALWSGNSKEKESKGYHPCGGSLHWNSWSQGTSTTSWQAAQKRPWEFSGKNSVR